MKSIILAWLVGTGLMAYKDVAKNKRPPLPAELLAESGLFVLLGILGEPAPRLASTLAWGFDLAAFLTLWDNPAGAAIKSANPTSKSKTAKAK